jgi:hypothetical protein
LDSTLGQQDRAEVFAFASMVEGQLLSAMLYDWWMVDDNYYEVIRPIYRAAASFPASFILPWSIRFSCKLHRSQCCAEPKTKFSSEHTWYTYD